LAVDASCGLTPAVGVACVSHFTGRRTTPSAAACWAFHSLTASVASSRSSGMSPGDAISTRYVVALNMGHLGLSLLTGIFYGAAVGRRKDGRRRRNRIGAVHAARQRAAARKGIGRESLQSLRKITTYVDSLPPRREKIQERSWPCRP